MRRPLAKVKGKKKLLNWNLKKEEKGKKGRSHIAYYTHLSFPTHISNFEALSLSTSLSISLSRFGGYTNELALPSNKCCFHLGALFMQSPKTSKTRKPWYQKAVEMTTLWKVIFKSPTSTNSTLWKTINSTEIQAPSSNPNNTKQKLRKCTSLKVATTFTRVCLCAPISSYNEVFNGELLPPRRSYSYPRSTSNNNNNKPFPPPPHHHHHHHPQPTTLTTQLEIRVPSGRHSIEGRKVFRGKSLSDDVLMRRFVIEEEAMMQIRRRNQMEIIRMRRAALRRRKKLGPSPLSRMVLAEEQEEEDDDDDHQECSN